MQSNRYEVEKLDSAAKKSEPRFETPNSRKISQEGLLHDLLRTAISWVTGRKQGGVALTGWLRAAIIRVAGRNKRVGKVAAADRIGEGLRLWLGVATDRVADGGG